MFYLGAVLLAIANVSVSGVHGPFTYFKAGKRKILVLRELDGNIFISSQKLCARVLTARRFSLAIPFPLRISEKLCSLQFTVACTNSITPNS